MVHFNNRLLAYSIIFTLVFPPHIWAAALSTDGGTNTSVDAAQNGVPVVNIATPNADGVSRNTYNDFNVSQQGLILNNANQDGVSQLGGAMVGNANLRDGPEASIILNEVTSARASTLNGYTETFGGRAEFILANPNGISCNGCGFINTSRASLITGSEINPVGLPGAFRMGNGTIVIGADGLNGANVDYIDIITRAAEIQGQLQARQRLGILTGNGQYDYQSRVITSYATNASTPVYAIDASLLGSMYAGYIQLITTEQGVGVHTQAEVVATDDLYINTKEDLIAATLEAGRALTVNAGNTITQEGEFSAGQSLTLEADTLVLNWMLSSDRDMRLVQRQGDLSVGAINGGTGLTELILQNGNLLVDNKIYAAGDLSLQANDITNNNSIASRKQLTINANNLTNNSGAVIFAGKVMDLNVENHLLNYQDILSMGSIDIANAAGGMMVSFENRGGWVESAGDMSISAETVTNTTNDVAVVMRVGDSGGFILDPAWHEELNSNLKSGEITSVGTLSITANTLNNINSSIYSVGNLTIDAKEINNTGYTYRQRRMVPYPNREVVGQRCSGTRYRKKCLWGNWLPVYGYVTRYKMENENTGQNIASTIATAGTVTLKNAKKITNTNGASDATGVGAPAVATEQNNNGNDTLGNPLDGLILPGEGGLFSPNLSPSPEHPYQIETDPRLIDISNLYGSDYFLEQVGYDPEADTAIFLGDAYYEQRVIAEQVREALGTRYIFDNVANDNDQYRNLAEQAAAERDRLGLDFGTALSSTQINELDQDIVWYVETDFNGISVLAPRLYLSQATRDARRLNGATIMAADINIDGESILNEGNIIATNSIDIDVEDDLLNLGGSIESGGDMAIATGGDFISESTIWEFESGVTQRSGIASAASVTSGGNMTITSAGDLRLIASNVSAGGDALLSAANDLSIEAIEHINTEHKTRGNTNTATTRKTHSTSNIDITGNLKLASGNNMLVEGADIRTGESASLDAGVELMILAVQDETETTSVTHRSNWYSSSTTTDTKRQSSNKSATIKSGTDLSLHSGNNMMLVAADINTGGDASLTTDGGSIQLLAAMDVSFQRRQTESDDLFYTKTSDKGHSKETVIGTSIKSGGNLHINTRAANDDRVGNVLIAGSNVGSSGDINIGDNLLAASSLDENSSAGVDNLMIATVSANNKTWDKTEKKLKGGLATLVGVVASALGADVEMESSASNESDITSQVGSSVDTAGNLTIHTQGDTTIAGSSVDVAGNADLQTGGNFNVLAAIDSSSTRESQSRTSLEGMSYEETDSRASIGIDGKKTSSSQEENTQTVVASILNIGGKMNIDAGDKVAIVGSDLTSEGTMIIDAKSGVEIVSAEEVTETLDKEFEGKTRLSVGLGNAYLDVSNAKKALDEARRAARGAKQALFEFDAEIVTMQQGLADGTVTLADIDARQKDRRLFLANIDAARVNVASKLAALGSAGVGMAEAAIASAGTGFYADLQVDTSGETTSKSSTTTSVRSSYITSNGGHIVINTNKDIDIEGSDLQAAGQLLLLAKEDIHISAAKESTTTSEETASTNSSINMGLYGKTSSGTSVSASSNESKSESEAVNHRLSSLMAGGGVMIESGADTDMIGAYVDGDTLDIDVGGDLTVTSVQNTYTSTSTSSGSSISLSGVDVPPSSVGANGSEETSDRAWVDERTTLIGRDSVNINVADETNLTAASIAQVGYDGVEGDNLSLTTGSLTVNNLEDRDINESSNAGLTLGGSSTTIQVGNEGRIETQTGYSVIGQGDITLTKADGIEGEVKRSIGDETKLTANRNTGGLNLDVTVDHNLVTEKGREEIAVNLIETGMHASDIAVVGLNYLGDDEMGFKDAQKMIAFGHKSRTGQQRTLEKEGARKGLNHVDASAAEVQDGMQDLSNEILGSDDAKVYLYDGMSAEVGVDKAGSEYNKNISAAGYDNNSGNVVVNTSGINVDMTSTDHKVEVVVHEGVHAYSGQNDVSMGHGTEEGLAGYYGGQAEMTYGMYSALGGYETDVGAGSTSQADWNRDNRASSTVRQGNEFVQGVRSEDVDAFNISASRNINEPDKFVYKVGFTDFADDAAQSAVLNTMDKASKKKAQVLIKAEEALEEFVFGKAVSYDKDGLGVYQYFNEYITDVEFTRAVGSDLLERLQSGATEEDVRIFLEAASKSVSYDEMNYPEPEMFIEKVQLEADDGFYNRAKKIEAEGLSSEQDYKDASIMEKMKADQHERYDDIFKETGIRPYSKSE